MSIEKFNHVVNTELLDVIHKTIRMLKASCSLPSEELDDKVREEHLECNNRIFTEEGEQFKKAINQFIDLQLNAYGNFKVNDSGMYWYNENDNAISVKIKNIPTVYTY